MTNVQKFCDNYQGMLEDLIDVMESDIDDLYLTDAEWDDVYKNVIDPINKAISHLEIIHDMQDDDEPSNDDDSDEDIIAGDGPPY